MFNGLLNSKEHIGTALIKTVEILLKQALESSSRFKAESRKHITKTCRRLIKREKFLNLGSLLVVRVKLPEFLPALFQREASSVND